MPISTACPAQSRNLSYDFNGNRTAMTDASGTTYYGYASGSNVLTYSSGAVNRSFSYDGAGNLTSDGLTALTYDARNRPASIGASSYAHTPATRPLARDNVDPVRIARGIGGISVGPLYISQRLRGHL